MRVPAWMLAGLAGWMGLLAAGCGSSDFRPEAIGPEGEIIVVIDSARWEGPVGEALRDALGRQIATLPNPEPSFTLRRYGITSEGVLDMLKSRRNLVFAAPLEDSTTEALFLRNLLSEEARQSIAAGSSAAVVPREDVWRRRQQVLYLTAQTPGALAQAIREDGDRLRNLFNDVSRTRLAREMFEKGRQRDIEEQLMERYGFAVNAQHDYLVAVDTTDFVWLRRILSDTWRSLFVYFEEDANPGKLTADWVYRTRDSLAREYLQGSVSGWAAIDARRPLFTEEVNFEGRYGLETRGLWQMIDVERGDTIQLGGGGPFVNYSFYDQDTGRLYMIDGMVFAPNYPKREFLRQMEVIAHTFRTREDEERAEAEVAARE